MPHNTSLTTHAAPTAHNLSQPNNITGVPYSVLTPLASITETPQPCGIQVDPTHTDLRGQTLIDGYATELLNKQLGEALIKSLPSKPPLSAKAQTASGEVAAFLDEFDAITVLHRNYKGFDRFADRLLKLLRGFAPPKDIFPFIAEGAFKECYDAYEGWVVKFATDNNPTAIEQYLYRAASRRTVDVLFPETHYLPLPIKVPVDRDFDNFFPVMILQRAAQPMLKENCCCITTGLPADHPLLDIAPPIWVKEVVKAYGAPAAEALYHFTEEFGVTDLHQYNIGYMNDLPVIFDWMTR